MTPRLLLLSLSVSLAGLVGFAGCGPIDEHVAEWCDDDDHCTCDEEGRNCCITEGGHCYDGQCCDGLVCNPSGRCVAQ
ncbi:MAG TPA: hypothetical protein VK013_05625 [Myxococcaceae bacterium]|nr:hypothetical protein [Myxococcaceae bacterium]